MRDETTRQAADVLRETLAAITFLPQEMVRINQQAAAIYTQAQATVAQYERMGMALRPIQCASLEDIRTHLRFCAALGRIHHANVNPDQYFGQMPEEIADTVAAKAARQRRGRGARAVARQYGDQAAFNITGHHINH